MTYLLLALGFLAVATAVLVLARRRGTSSRRRPSLRAIALSVAVLAVMTVVFDNIMIAAGLFGFAPEHLLGVMLGRAPVEDLSYPLAAALLLPALWHLLGENRPRGPSPAARGHAGEPRGLDEEGR